METGWPGPDHKGLECQIGSLEFCVGILVGPCQSILRKLTLLSVQGDWQEGWCPQGQGAQCSLHLNWALPAWYDPAFP